MTKIIENILKEAGIEHTTEIDALIKLIVAECIDAVKNSNTHHASTTFSLDIANASKDKAVKAIIEKFYGKV